MKNILAMLFGILFSINSFSQGIDYPRYEVDSLGQKVVVMTIDQAQKLDNNTDLLALFEQLNQQIGGFDSICVKAINDKEVVISEQKILISELNNGLDIKDKKIEALQKEVTEYQLREVMLNKQLDNLHDQIDLKDKKIKEQKVKMVIGGGVGGVAIIGLILGMIFIK